MRAVGLLLIVLAFGGCGLPNDPEGTLERARGGTIKVGVSESLPWVDLSGSSPSGVEVELVETFAESIDADIEWIDGSVEDLAGALHEREIDLLIAGLEATASVAAEVTLTHPYLTTQIVVGGPPGEVVEDIAGIEVSVETGSAEAGILEKTDAIPVRVADVTEATGYVAIPNYLIDDLDLADTGVRLEESDHVFATPNGENAWLVKIERFLLENEAVVHEILEREDMS